MAVATALLRGWDAFTGRQHQIGKP
jgi:hypothetical protein